MDPQTNYWGWKTTPVEDNWNDDAVWKQGPAPGPWNELTYDYLPPPWDGVTNHPYRGYSVNMAYELFSDICPQRCKKWVQGPDMVEGTDMESWRRQTVPGGLRRADDFVSDGRPITDIHWWGSYLDWEFTRDGSETNPIPPPTGRGRPTGFDLSWHAADPGMSLPGDLLTNLYVSIAECHEVYFGTVTQTWEQGGPGIDVYEHEYQYYVDLADTNVSHGPWLELQGTHYWVNVQAVFADQFEPGQYGHNGWGWKIAPSTQLCWSAVSQDGGKTWFQDTLMPPHPRANTNFDLSFELTTTNIPGTNQFSVSFVRMERLTSPDAARLWTTGYCGCGQQVLQTSRDLIQGAAGWTDVQTKPVPRPVNVWKLVPPGPTNYYRVRMK